MQCYACCGCLWSLCDRNQRSVLHAMASSDEAVQLAVEASPLEMTMWLLYSWPAIAKLALLRRR
jgi:hypothetical protein